MTNFQVKHLGKYILLDKLAVGGMAELYRAMITGVQGFEKLIAIKKILPHLANEEVLVRSFIDEAKLAALLHHQNIVQIYDFGSLGDTYFIAMEYLIGKDCKIITRKAKESNIQLELQYALYIVSRICAGLNYAHKLKDFQGKPLNIIHRDISPQNVLITYEGDVKIVDFGIAKAASQTTMTQMGMIKGKVAYMSPEQAAGKTIDHRSDIFSCGIILYEMVTGKRMFSGDTMHILACVRDAVFTKPEEVRDNLPDTLIKIISRALEKDPSRRYQSCGDMLTDLEECMSQLDMRPTAHGLAKYMKTLFADEIADEELQMQKISQIGLMQEEIEPQAETPTPLQSFGKLKLGERCAALLEPFKTKSKLIAGGLGGLLLVIGIIVVLSQNKGQPPSQLSEQRVQEQPPSQLSDQRVQEEPRSQLSEQRVQKEPLPTVSEKTATDESTINKETPGTELYKDAMDALVNKRYKDAIALFEEMLTLGPSMQDKIAIPYSEALVGMAESLRETDGPQAITLFEKAIRINQESEQAYFQLGMQFMKQKDYPKAIESFEKVIELNPTFPDSFFNLGFIYAISKDYAKAEKMYTRVVELAPKYLDEALFNLAIVQEKQGKEQECIINLEKAVAVNQENEQAKNYLKKLKGDSGDTR